MGKKVLIVGGVAGGASAAARLRRLDEEAEIILFERDGYISYANCGLPYYIGETIKDREKLLVQTPEAMKSRFGIDVRIHSEVISVVADKKCVLVQSSERGQYEETFDSLILSPGARALRPDIPGINSTLIHTLRNVTDTDRIKALIDEKKPFKAVVVGGGFVGIEMAENLKERGIEITLVEAAPHILAPFDDDMVIAMEQELEQNGVNLILKDGIESFRENQEGIQVNLKSGKTLPADFVILAMGVRPDTTFLNSSGIECSERGHILVNDRMETNIKDIYAVGDAIQGMDFVTGERSAVALAGPANKQGRIAADNISGLCSKFDGFLGTSIIKVFQLTAARTGASERTLKASNIDYKMVHLYPMSHASYYPGGHNISLKLMFDPQGKILGAQASGYDGVDKRIDVISTVISMRGTVEDLTRLDLSYAPPYSSAKDPVNMAGYAAENVLRGLSHITTWDKVFEHREEILLLDVRDEVEYSIGHVEGSVNIPLNTLRSRLSELGKDQKIIAYCKVGQRGYIADRILTQNGYHSENVTGGFQSFNQLLHEEKTEPVRQETKQNTVKVRPEKQAEEVVVTNTLDATGLCCPGPLLRVKQAMEEQKNGEILKVTASDPGFYEDVNAWCKSTQNQLLNRNRENGNVTALIRKGIPVAACSKESGEPDLKNNKTIVVFSGDLDKAIASFIIANGAASMGKKVTMFFTFWGLNILRKPEKVKLKKGFMDSMFGSMMPRGSKKLKLSQMNYMGMGAQMIRAVMKNKNVDSLEGLIEAAISNGVEIVACQMSMDVMGLKKEELIDGVKIGGVGYYLGEAEESNVNLFI
ncbi:CoA-disulfide reductase [Lacrimispora algidixylanolytica]|uniref:Pyridine nucleotide-disulfide oxidoreductase n=1 Tax=Lacrimispora algidixylanolytica TaxID=94868 RepID=A0A419T804_9FIRM|nr:CoA-disulfide reductase [Lacrimispora algidixylanolytica]RKD33553.1 pyridine nucleotide-disulfide oxidoreductase [Lacrimispora algidixylanolytica]